ncbi:DMT family transporter [Nocardioides zeicaulis]|uniref:DMT family transporter n=1 Tax=Nocardioides zeicaulis TaxID=1776857 RepID=A0ABV6E3H4_9ACTN
MTTTSETTNTAPDERTSPAPWLPVAAGAVTLVMWASAFVVIRHVAGDVSPGALGAGRLLVAALVVLPLVLRRGWVSPTRREWGLLALGGLGWFGVYNLALNAGERHVDAGTAAMIIQIGPVIVALVAVPLFGERLHAWLVAGMVVGFAGVAVIARGSSDDPDASLVGVLLVLLAAAMYAVGVLTQKVLLRRLPSVQVVLVSFLIGAVTCLPFAGDLPGIVADGGAELWWVVYLGVFPTAIAFTTWAFALTHTDAGALSLTTFLVPLIATFVAWVTIDEVPPSLTFVGGALAIVGVLMTRRKPRPVG